MFIGRRLDGSIYGSWTCKQLEDEYHPNVEEVSDDHPDLVKFLAPKLPDPRIVLDNIELKECKDDGPILTLINQTRSEWLAWAQSNFPTLTKAEQTRVGIICWLLSISIRKYLRN